jgi:hypothetical protein
MISMIFDCEFKQKLKALCDEYADAPPRVRQLAHTVSDHAGLGRISSEESHRQAVEGLRMARPR